VGDGEECWASQLAQLTGPRPLALAKRFAAIKYLTSTVFYKTSAEIRLANFPADLNISFELVLLSALAGCWGSWLMLLLEKIVVM